MSLQTRDEWLFVDEVGGFCTFIRIDFNRQLYGQWKVENKKANKKICLVSCTLPEDGELHFICEQALEVSQISERFEKVKESIRKQAEFGMNEYIELGDSESVTGRVSNPSIGQNLAISGYIFQLKNPPRAVCDHLPKCALKKFRPFKKRRIIDLPDELALFYPSCSTEEQVKYLYTWSQFAVYLETLRFVLGAQVEFVESDTSSCFPTDSLVLLQCRDQGNNYVTLLDFPNSLNIHRKFSCLDSTFKLIEIEGEMVDKLLNGPIETRRYLVVTQNNPNKWSKYVIDYDGNVIADLF
ncbi:unnamed protein product, partial [Mesorhabditis belari]|uniref:Uncharacterized protein n=1 Tax=Mesorhabditis belari TaxID=2138241 RepID=A0AAF3FU63_9BILA